MKIEKIEELTKALKEGKTLIDSDGAEYKLEDGNIVNSNLSCGSRKFCLQNDWEIEDKPDYKDWVGKFCWFWEEDMEEIKRMDILKELNIGSIEGFFRDNDGDNWKNCRLLTVKEIAKYIYKG